MTKETRRINWFGAMSQYGILVLCISIIVLSGCAPNLKKFAPQLDPIRVQQQNLKPISFKGVVLRIPIGEEIGHHYDGLAKVSQYSLHWQSGITFGSDEFILGASETLRSCGYNVMGGSDLLFNSDNGAKATLQLGATITNLKYNTFGSLAGNYNEAVVDVEWQLYDALRKEIVFKYPTNGYSKSAPIDRPAVFDAFNNALKNLLAVPSFVEIIVKDKENSDLNEPKQKIEIVIAKSSIPIRLPDNIDRVGPAIVTIKAGATHGSGFLISEDGYIITAAHVVHALEDAQILLNSGISLNAKVIAIDNEHDIALMKLPGSGYVSIYPCLNQSPKLGDQIFALGTPYSEALSLTLTSGIVSGVREIDGSPFIQTDASLNPGNSGGPLLNAEGQVVAIVSWKIVAQGFEGLAFGVPITSLENCLNIEFIEK